MDLTRTQHSTDPRTNERATLNAKNCCNICEDAITLGWIGMDTDKLIEQCKTDENFRKEVMACARVLLNPDTADHIMATIEKAREIGKRIEVEYSMLPIHALKEAIRKRLLRDLKIDGKINPADLGTKGLDQTLMLRHLKTLNIKLSNSRSSAMPKSLMEIYDCDWSSISQIR